MSIEVETAEHDSPNGQLKSVTASPRVAERLPIWRQRRYQFGTLIVAIALVAALVGNNVLAGQYTPDGAVRQYLAALQAGDAARAWDAIQVAAPTASVAATVTDKAALQAALVAGKPDIKHFTVIRTSQLTSTTTAVEVTYDTSRGSQQPSSRLSAPARRISGSTRMASGDHPDDS
jgi:hypothetical protein